MPDRRLLIVSQFYWPEPTGSAPLVTDIAKWFVENGYEVTVLTSRPFYPPNRSYAEYRDGARDTESIDGVHIHRMPTRRPTGGDGLLARAVNETHFLARAHSTLRRGVVRPAKHVLSVSPSIFAASAARRFGQPGARNVVLVHDIQSGLAGALFNMRGRVVRAGLELLERRVLNQMDTVVVMSTDITKELRRIGVRVPIQVLPPHVDLKEIVPLDYPSDSPAQVLYSGNLGRKQGLMQLLAAASIMQADATAIVLTIRGEGSQEGVLRAAAKQMQLHNVRFEPLAERQDLNAVLGAARVHVLCQEPSGSSFAVPSKVFTMMASGRPVVCAVPSSPVWRQLELDSGGLVIVPPNDPLAFASAVRGLVDEPERAATMGRKARQFVERFAGRDNVMLDLEEMVFGRLPS